MIHNFISSFHPWFSLLSEESVNGLEWATDTRLTLTEFDQKTSCESSVARENRSLFFSGTHLLLIQVPIPVDENPQVHWWNSTLFLVEISVLSGNQAFRGVNNIHIYGEASISCLQETVGPELIHPILFLTLPVSQKNMISFFAGEFDDGW